MMNIFSRNSMTSTPKMKSNEV